MRRYQLFSLLFLSILSVVISGCGKKKPADFPEVLPFTVKVVDGSTPIEGVQVFFIYDGNPVVSGLTNAQGIAEITTMYQKYTAKGAPAGEYKVQLSKEPLAEHWKSPEEQMQMTKEEKDAYLNEWLTKCKALPREIPANWGNYDKTPLTASVSIDSKEITFDVEGKANN